MLTLPDDPMFIEWLNDNMDMLHALYSTAYSVGHNEGATQHEFKCPRCGSPTEEHDVPMEGWTGRGDHCTRCEWPDEPTRDFEVVS